MDKLTIEQAVENELYNIGEAIGNCLELNVDFIDRYCGENVQAQLNRLDNKEDRDFALKGCIGEGYDGGYSGGDENSITLPMGEIEVQFTGTPEEYFEDPEEWAINGDLAYYPVNSAVFKINVDELRKAIDDMLEEEQ